MANMSYCRFQNTLQDLRDCYDNMDDDDLSDAETNARYWLLKMCDQIASDYVFEGDPQFPKA